MRCLGWWGCTLLLAAIIVLGAIGVSGCGNNSKGAGALDANMLIDNRDGKTYKTVDIDGKTWMAENLNYRTPKGSWCHSDNNSNCAKYGRLYDWNTARTVCPIGWHLPSREEWGDLVVAVGGDSAYGNGGKMASMKLKSTSGWDDEANGTDDYGFSAMAGGDRDPDGSFGDVGYSGAWWTVTEHDSAVAYYRSIEYEGDGDVIYESSTVKSYGFSVRCVLGSGDSTARYAMAVSSAGIGASNGGSYAEGVVVSITAGTPPTGQQFKNWTSSGKGVIFYDSNSRQTSFIMPANDIAVTAKFEKMIAQTDTFTDSRDGKKYKKVKMPDGKVWMGENLNYQPQIGRSWCYKNDNSNCDKYGRLYDWNTALTVCPSGWSLPTRQNWTDLVQEVGGERAPSNILWAGAGTKLKATSDWYNNGNGKDDYGFSGLPGGCREFTGDFTYAGYDGMWWTATESGTGSAYYYFIRYHFDDVLERNDSKENSFSVRCIQNK